MAHTRRTASSLTDPKVSVVIPVYNEKDTIFEILRRVMDTDVRKEIVIVDDCSKDGTRDILENMVNLQASGETQAPALDGGDPVALNEFVSFSRRRIREKARRCGAVSRRPAAISCWCRTPIWNTIRSDYPKLLEPILDGRADVVFGSRFLGGPQRVHYFWHYVANKGADAALGHFHESEAYGHGDVLQSVPPGSVEGNPDQAPTASGSSRRSPRKFPKATGGFTKCRSAMPAARMKKERKLPGKTACRRSGASFATRLATEAAVADLVRDWCIGICFFVRRTKSRSFTPQTPFGMTIYWA